DGHRKKIIRIAWMTALPAAVALSVGFAAVAPSVGSHDSPRSSVVAPAHPLSARDLLLASSDRLLATPPDDGQVFWVKTAEYHPDSPLPVPPQFAQFAPPPLPARFTVETAQSHTAMLTTYTLPDGQVRQQRRIAPPPMSFEFGVGGLSWDEIRN